MTDYFQIENHNSKLVISADGGALISYVYRGFDYFGMRLGSRYIEGSQGQVLIPWPNRIQDGRYSYMGYEYQLPINEVEKHNSIHGLIRWTKFKLVKVLTDSVDLMATLVAQPGYPFELEIYLTYRLLKDSVSVQTKVVNLSNRIAPLGIGWHPYFRVSDGLIDACKLTIPADSVLVTDSRAIPTITNKIIGSELDFTRDKIIADVVFDTCYLNFNSSKLKAVLTDPAEKISLVLTADLPYKYLMVYSGDTLKDESKRRRQIALEPMTCPPNALKTQTDILEISPKQSVISSWKVTIS
jgi:galactose mutarotase-like enzyme